MSPQSVELKRLLKQRHWQTYETFCTEYDKVATSVDVNLVGSWPSRAQFHRWLSGALKGLPYPHHCRVLETMFPGRSAAELFAFSESERVGPRNAQLDNTSMRGQDFRDGGETDSGMRLVTSAADLSSAMIGAVVEAKELIVSVGSRSREPAYLMEIEQTLEREPDLIHYRILIGPPHSQILKDHLRRLAESAEARLTNSERKRLYVSILDDLVNDHERFFVATEQVAVVLLPSAHSPGNFDTGLVVRNRSYVQALIQHGKALYGRRRLETVGAVDELSVLR
jgi:hypothetical protein